MKSRVIRLAFVLCCVAYPVYAQTGNVTITPIIGFLLDDNYIDFPVSWNDQRVTKNQSMTAEEGSVNLVSIDYTQLPAAFSESPESISFDVSGACYQLFSGSSNQTVFEYNVVGTEPGICTLQMQIGGATQTLTEALAVVITAQPPLNNMAKIIASADTSSGEAVVEGAFSFTNIQSWVADNSLSSNPGAVFSDDNKPNMFEFTASYQGVPLKGVMLTTTRKLDSRNFSNLDVDSRTHVRFVDNQPALIGSGKVTGSAGNTNTFAFIATGLDTTLPGPTPGKEFHVGGKNKLNALCVQDRIVGFSLFTNERTLSRISTSLVGFTDKDCTANNNRFEGTTGVYADFQSINTHIGTILRGRGTAHPLNAGKLNTVDDQDDNDPDYALYFLGLAERVSDAHQVVQLDADTVIRSNVFVFDPFAISKIAKIRRELGTMVFKEAPEILTGITVGDIIVGKPSARLRDGFLREVTAKGQQNGLFFLQTKPAKLDQFFAEGGFDLSTRELTLEDLDEVVVPEYYGAGDSQTSSSTVTFGYQKTTTSYQSLKSQQRDAVAQKSSSGDDTKGFLTLPLPKVSFDHVFIDQDNNFNTTNDQWRTEGRFELGASITAQFRCQGFVCSKPYFLLKFDFTEDFELSGHIFTDFNNSMNTKHTITSMKFGRIWIGPVSVRPQIDLNVILSGETDTDVEFGVDQFFTAELGIELEDGDWSTINNQSFGISASPTPDYQPNDGTADVTARAALEGSVKLSGIRVGAVDAGIYTDLKAATPRDPLWEVTAGLSSEAYIEIDLLLGTIRGGPFELFDIPFNIEGGEAPDFPPEISSIKVDGVETENGVAVRKDDPDVEGITVNSFSASASNPLTIKVKVFDPDVGYDCCSVTLSDLTTGEVVGTRLADDVTNTNNYKFELTELTTGSHTMQVKVSAPGIHANDSPVETFTIAAVDVNALLSDCEAIDLKTAVGEENITITEGNSVLLRVRLSEGCLIENGNEVSFYESPQGINSLNPFLTVDTSDENGKSIAYASAYLDFSKVGTQEFVAKYTDRRGDRLTSNPVVVKVESLFPQIIGDSGENTAEFNDIQIPSNTTFDACSGGPCLNAGLIAGFAAQDYATQSSSTQAPTKSAKAESSKAAAAPSQPSNISATPSNTEPHRLRADNWSTGETAYFKNPFPVLDDYSVLWSIDDNQASVTTDVDGNGEITPATSGWYRVTVSYTHDTAPQANRRYIKNRIFFVSPNTDKKWRGYEQETIDDDATRLEMMSGMLGGSPI